MGIFVNQVGYKTGEKKEAVVTSDNASIYKLIDAENGNTILVMNAGNRIYDKASGDETAVLDFSDIDREGRYYIEAEDGEKSDCFCISSEIYREVQNAMTKALYFQRCGCALEEKYAGVYTHAACHTEDAILLKDFVDNAANPIRFEVKGGWHDAGDYGRYATPAAVAVGHLLYAYELFPESFKDELNIPETGNGIPDVLNECRYELDWLMKLQTADGGVYHKLTAFRHCDFVMPEEDKDQFILYPVSSMAVADFAAVMALASRVYSSVDPGFSDRALKAARLSFDWLTKNGFVDFHNPKNSNTGEYGDASDEDERMWAAAEMLRTDKDGDAHAYKCMLQKYASSDIPKTDFGWTDVSGFALMSIITDAENSAGDEIRNIVLNALFEEADRLVNIQKESGYPVSMLPDDYVWGSNMTLCNRGMLLILASMYGKEKSDEYSDASYNMLHYLLGRNALGRSYVTGFGEHAFKNPHNRPTASDGIEDPMPGWVSGGPFKPPFDIDAQKIIPKGTPPMKCHADVVGSYSTNEITIYWNSPAVFMCSFFNSRK